jgi:hypothetical protein
MLLRETSTQWGNIYKNRYYLDGVRISESYASVILKTHYWEGFPTERGDDGTWRKEWNIGPRMSDSEIDMMMGVE